MVLFLRGEEFFPSFISAAPYLHSTAIGDNLHSPITIGPVGMNAALFQPP
jgi:hypothetical protein